MQPVYLTQHFTKRELECRCGCGLVAFHPGVLGELQALRTELELPMKVTSACRCKAHNDRPLAEGGAGGHRKSLHVGDHEQHPGQRGALGFDVETQDGAYRGKLFALAWRRGWSIGWNAARKFLHIDRRDFIGLPQSSFDY